MKRLTLLRLCTGDMGTEGILLPDDSETALCRTMELPWRANQRKISCIPLGEYPIKLAHSPKFGWTYLLEGVPDRSHVLIHRGNLAGAVDRGLKTHSEGCILVGTGHGWLRGQRAVLASAPAYTRLMDWLDGEDAILKVDALPTGDKR